MTGSELVADKAAQISELATACPRPDLSLRRTPSAPSRRSRRACRRSLREKTGAVEKHLRLDDCGIDPVVAGSLPLNSALSTAAASRPAKAGGRDRQAASARQGSGSWAISQTTSDKDLDGSEFRERRKPLQPGWSEAQSGKGLFGEIPGVASPGLHREINPA
jgi:hypothetical protein